jgi:Mg/Co/Ni transporter MgtE
MSPRAAWRLEELGFERVYHFVGGKTEWIERGLPTEGTGPFLLLVGQVVRPAMATCRPDARASSVRRELTAGPDSICAVVNEHDIVVGSIRRRDLPDDDDLRAEAFMHAGPATVRPSEELSPLLDRMRAAGVRTILVTTARGQLLGIVDRDEGERFVRSRAAKSRSPDEVS